MRVVPYDFKNIELKRGHYKKTEMQKILEEFLASGQDCVKIEDFNHKDASGCASSLNLAAKRYKMTGAKAISTKGEVFLVKASLLK